VAEAVSRAYQLLCIHVVNSVILTLTGAASIYNSARRRNWQEVQETGRCFPCPAAYSTAVASLGPKVQLNGILSSLFRLSIF